MYATSISLLTSLKAAWPLESLFSECPEVYTWVFHHQTLGDGKYQSQTWLRELFALHIHSQGTYF